MTNFVDALQEKIDELEDAKSRIDEKIELLRELLESEAGPLDAVSLAAATGTVSKKRPGRPKGAKSRKVQSIHGLDDELFAEAQKQLAESGEATTPELQERMTRRFKTVPRPAHNYGNIKAGTKKEVDEARSASMKTDSHVSVED